jgi:hypothetical protein
MHCAALGLSFNHTDARALVVGGLHGTGIGVVLQRIHRFTFLRLRKSSF